MHFEDNELDQIELFSSEEIEGSVEIDILNYNITELDNSKQDYVNNDCLDEDNCTAEGY